MPWPDNPVGTVRIVPKEGLTPLFPRLARLAALALVVNLFAAPADACSMCMVAAGDRALPPIHAWLLLGVVWFVGTSVAAARSGARLRGVPSSPFRAVLLVMLLLFLYGGVVGPLVLPALLLGPATAALRSVAGCGPGSRVFGGVMLTAAGVLVCVSVGVRLTRTPGEYVTRWARTGPGMEAFRSLEQGGAASLDDYRYIAAHASGDVAEQAAARVENLTSGRSTTSAGRP